MSRRGSSCVRWLAAGAVAASVLGAPAHGQLQQSRQKQQDPGAPVSVTPPRPNTADRAPVVWMILMAAVLGAGVVGTALIPSKRGHQD